ncbi:P-loop containing nucleoside triphosphate hydrolase protein, partial [Hyaloscypha bicolor E]
YSNYNNPYRRGYLLYGPPGTGKSSLSSAITSYFGLNIYILSLSTISEANLKSLFNKLPSHYIILLEDINTISSNRDTKTEDSRQIVIGSLSRISKSAALIRPGRIDKKVELGLADHKITADLFCLIFKPREEAERVKRLVKGFTTKVPELKFSLAEIFLFLLEYRKLPEGAINNMEQLISKPIKAKSKPPRISEDTKPEDT